VEDGGQLQATAVLSTGKNPNINGMEDLMAHRTGLEVMGKIPGSELGLSTCRGQRTLSTELSGLVYRSIQSVNDAF
jgi:hypothetical protein